MGAFHTTPQPDAGLDALVADMRKDISIASDLLHERWKAQSKAVSRRLEDHHDKTIPAIITALRDRPVRALVWDAPADGRGEIAVSAVGQYAAFDEGDPRWAYSMSGGYTYHKASSLEAAKAAAQADYEARIRAALEGGEG